MMCQMLDWRAHRTFCHRRDKDVTRGVTSHENKKTLRPLEDFFQSDGSCTIFQSCLCGATDHACAIREKKALLSPTLPRINSIHQALLGCNMRATALIYFIGGRRHSGCRAMSPGPPTPHSYPPMHKQEHKEAQNK